MIGDDVPAGDAISAAERLTASLNGLTGRLDSLGRYGRHNRRMIFGLAGSIVLDLVLTVGIALVAVQAKNAHDFAAQVRATQVSNCLAANVTRAQNIGIWDYVLSVPPATPPTAQQQKIRADFRAYIHRVFAPRNCNRL